MSEFDNYYKTHSDYSERIPNAAASYWRHDKNFWDVIKKIDKKQSRIVEIGCWYGLFADYCHALGFENYVWFDLDADMIAIAQHKHPSYIFYVRDALQYLKQHAGDIDIVFMSHVFEHMSIDDGKILAKAIFDGLRPWWFWLNSMPNASSPYLASHIRYGDITHKVIYNENSFNQILLSTGFIRECIAHKNEAMGGGIWWRIVAYRIGISINRLLWALSAYIPNIYTLSMISFIQKK